MITVGELKSLLDYNPSTGLFIWKSDRTSTVREGDVAGTNCKGYITITINGKRYQAHRLAWLYMTGNLPNNQIDHINGVRDDNRFCNLREVDNSENARNSKHRDNNTSGHIGVNFEVRGSKWTANIKVDGKKIYLGRFPTKDEAIEARKKAEIKYGFHSNHGRRI